MNQYWTRNIPLKWNREWGGVFKLPPPYDLLNSEVIFNSLKGLSHNSFPITFGPAVNREALSHFMLNISNAITIDTQTYCTCVCVCVEEGKENHTALKQKAFVLFNDNFREHGHIHMHGERFKIQTSIHTDTQLLHSLRNFHSLWQNQQQTPECLYKFECQPGKAVRYNEETQVKTARGSVREGDGEVALHTQNGSTMWQTVSLSLRVCLYGRNQEYGALWRVLKQVVRSWWPPCWDATVPLWETFI